MSQKIKTSLIRSVNRTMSYEDSIGYVSTGRQSVRTGSPLMSSRTVLLFLCGHCTTYLIYVCPSVWLSSYLLPLYMGNGPLREPDAYRGVALQSVVLKLYIS